MDILGIDIGTVSVKYVRWRGKRGKGTVVSQGVYPYKESWEDLQGILSDIKTKEAGMVEISVGITSQEVVKKTFTMPILPKKELKEALAWSASKAVPTLEDMVYENVVLGEIDERGIKKQEILFVGANKSYINRILSSFEYAGFKRVTAVGDSGLACLPYAAQKGKGSFAVIDIGGRQTGIYIFDGRRLAFVREIMTASESFSDALMSGFGFSYEEAEAYKRTRGFNEESMECLSLPFERLVGEIQRTLSVHVQKYPGKSIEVIYVAGRVSKLPNFIDKLRSAFAETVDYLEARFDIGTEFLLAYFLCRYKGSLINILPAEKKSQEKALTYSRWVRVGGIAVMAILLMLSMGGLHNLNKVRSTLAIEKATFMQRKEQLKSMQNVGPVTQDNTIMLKREIDKKDTTLITVLQYLSSHLPKDVYLKEVRFDKYRKPETPSKDGQKGTPPKEDTNLKQTVKGAPAESLSLDFSPDALQDYATDTGYSVTMQGYVFGDAEQLIDADLLDLMIKLERSGIMKGVTTLGKEMKELKGRKVMEFTIQARCASHES